MSDHLLSILETQIQSQEQLLREREQDLEQLRRHRDRLTELSRSRDELQNQLRVIENDMALLERTMSSTLIKFGARLDTPQSAPAATQASHTSEPPIPPTPRPRAVEPAAPAAEPKASTPELKTLSIRDIIRKVLKAARQPLTGPDLADRVLATGYKTTSKDFPNTVKSALSQMEDVEHVRGQGYRITAGSRKG